MWLTGQRDPMPSTLLSESLIVPPVASPTTPANEIDS
jgi:hypothetical protein